MSYPDVVNSSPQRSVNVMQRSQASPAALIESEAGIKRGHVNNMASLFGTQQNPSVSRRPSANHGRQQGVARKPSNGHLAAHGGASRSRTTRVPVVPREASISAKQAQAVSQYPSTSEVELKQSSVPHPAPWPKPTAQLKPLNSIGKPDSNSEAGDADARSSEATRANNVPGQPTIVINKAKYVPRTYRTGEKADLNSRRKSSELPSSVKVGRWTVYETLPFGKQSNPRDGKATKTEAQKKNTEDEEWKRLEALERERMDEAERRKNEYDMKHRKELEAQEMRRQEQMFAEEQRRKRELEREEEERLRRKQIEEQERRRLEEKEREVARQENERRLRESREKRRLEMQQEEEEQRQRMERRRQAEQDERERKRSEEQERRRAEERRRDEESRRREEELQRREAELQNREAEARRREREKDLNSNQDTYRAEEWTVFETVPTSHASRQNITASSSQPSFNSRYSNSTRGYRKPSGNENSLESDASIESEYMRNLREIEEKQRQQELAKRNQHSRQTDRQGRHRPEGGEDVQDENSNVHNSTDKKSFQESVNQWSALADMEPFESGSAVGYRRFLDDDNNTSVRTMLQDDRRRREEEEARARARNEAEEERRRAEESNRKRRDMEEAKRRREAEDRRHREDAQRRREAEERQLRQAEEDEKRRDSGRRRRQLEQERRRFNEDPWRDYNRESQLDRWNQHQGRLGRGFGDISNIFAQDEWEKYESIPAEQISADQSAVPRSPKQEDSVVGYRRLLEESDARPPKSGRSRSSDRLTKTRTRITDDSTNGRQRHDETSSYANYRGQGRVQIESASSDEETPHFEEWTEYHSVPPQLQASTDSIGGYHRQHSKLRRRSYQSDESEHAPTFEEWTVVQKVPASQAEFGRAGLDTVDADSRKYPAEYDDQERSLTNNNGHPTAHRGRIQLSDSDNPTGLSDEAFTVEEIMPQRRSSGRRQRNAIVEAALRQLESGPTSAFHDADDAVAAAAAADTLAERLSPYHSYQRIHHDRRGRYGVDNAAASGGSSSNGNVFQDSFSVRRHNPAFHWQD